MRDSSPAAQNDIGVIFPLRHSPEVTEARSRVSCSAKSAFIPQVVRKNPSQSPFFKVGGNQFPSLEKHALSLVEGRGQGRFWEVRSRSHIFSQLPFIKGGKRRFLDQF